MSDADELLTLAAYLERLDDSGLEADAGWVAEQLRCLVSSGHWRQKPAKEGPSSLIGHLIPRLSKIELAEIPATPALCDACGGYGRTLETRVTLDDSRFVWVRCEKCGGAVDSPGDKR